LQQRIIRNPAGLLARSLDPDVVPSKNIANIFCLGHGFSFLSFTP
jgi:hypothetical protein